MSNAEHAKPPEQLAIIGGGISGLTAAYYALKNGQDPASITIYEGAGRLGGKIQTGYLGGDPNRPVNMGAEFIDSDHTRLIGICNELGVKLKASNDQGNEIFQRPDGSRMDGDAFHAAYGPLHARIMADKAEVLKNPDGLLAQRINSLSMNDYLTELRQSTPAEENLGILKRVANLVTGTQNLVKPEITTMAMQAFASEVGQPPQNVSALQFLHEASAEAGSFLDSDCAYRVEGGTEKVIDALKQHLAEKGVKFETNAPVKRVEKDGNGSLITFDREGAAPVKAEKVVLALPAYALGKIEGLETLGMSPQARDYIGGMQYTNSVKFTVKLKDGMSPPDGNFFANHGMQVWSGNPGELTFLVNADKLEKMTAPQLVQASLENYARTNNMDPNALFDRSRGSIVFNNPGKASGCYRTQSAGDTRKDEHLAEALAGMNQHGVAVTGTFLPLKNENGIGVGFMECGIASSERAIDQLVAPKKERSAAMQQILDRGVSNDNEGHVAALEQRRAAEPALAATATR
ncbi:MAG: hypothetical protein DI582_00940 [Azospirillum brasilense]|nr:MAG: hypothetical protein DI582_00940 [Azospirillum brasilense]